MLEDLRREKRLHSSSFESSAYVWGKSGVFEALGYLPGFHLQHNPLIPETCIPDTEFGQSGSIQFLNILVVDPVGSCCPVSKRCPTGTNVGRNNTKQSNKSPRRPRRVSCRGFPGGKSIFPF